MPKTQQILTGMYKLEAGIPASDGPKSSWLCKSPRLDGAMKFSGLWHKGVSLWKCAKIVMVLSNIILCLLELCETEFKEYNYTDNFDGNGVVMDEMTRMENGICREPLNWFPKGTDATCRLLPACNSWFSLCSSLCWSWDLKGWLQEASNEKEIDQVTRRCKKAQGVKQTIYRI